MAKQPKTAKKSDSALVAGDVNGMPDEQKRAGPTKESPAGASTPSASRHRAKTPRAPSIPVQCVEGDDVDLDEDDSDLDDEEEEYEDEYEDDDEDEEEDEEDDDEEENYAEPEVLNLPAEGVANNDPELLAFLRTSATEKAAPIPLPDLLQERDDPRAPVVQELTTPLVVLPAAPLPWNKPFPLIASPQWYATLQYSRVIAYAYPGTELFKFLAKYGARTVVVRAHAATRTADTVRAAVERCRLRLILTLFDLEEADLKPARGGTLAGRANQLVRSLRRKRRRAVPRVCQAIGRDPEVGNAVLQALTKNADDHQVWELLMDGLNPDWRSGVPLLPAK